MTPRSSSRARPLAGSEATGVVDLAAKATDALDRANDAILAMAIRTSATIEDVLAKVTGPDEIRVEFGVGLTSQGTILIAGASAQATLKVMLTYHRTDDTTTTP